MNQHIIALDPGHGGRDPGAVGVIEEVKICEGVVKYLNQYLQTDTNYNPILTRPIDLQIYEGTISVKSRGDTATRVGAELLLSIHANSSTLVGPAGFESYPKVPNTPYHNESINFASFIVNEIRDMQPDIRGIDGIRFRYYASEAFAESNDTNLNNDDTYYGVVRIPNCPAVLVELCFVNTQRDVEKFNTDEKWKRAAVRFYYAICNYFSTTPAFDKDGLYIGSATQPIVNTGKHNLSAGATYKVKNKATGRMLNVYGAKIDQTNNVVQWTDDGSLEQQWILRNSDSTNLCLLYSKCQEGIVLDAYCPVESGCNAGIWTDDEPQAQLLNITQFGDYYKITLHSIPCLALTAIGDANGKLHGKYEFSEGNIYWSIDTHQDAQLWEFIMLEDKNKLSINAEYTIQNGQTARMLNLYAGITDETSNVVQWQADGSIEQNWQLKCGSLPDTYLFYTKCTNGKVLDAYRPSSLGGNVDVWTDDDPQNQNLVLSKNTDGTFKITLQAYPFLALTAIGDANGTLTGYYSTSVGNAYWSNDKNTRTQAWKLFKM